MENITYSLASPADEAGIKSILSQCELPNEDISIHLPNYVIGRAVNDIVGVIGLEVHGRIGLVRSLAVTPAFRCRGVAKELYKRILARAHLHRLKELYLLTATAAGYFSKLGFHEIKRDIIPESIRTTVEFQKLCPDTAKCMLIQLAGKVQYYPFEMLTLRPDVLGVRMWGVALDKTMLTYFEVNPNCRFDQHRHESEQITMVLKGELFFTIANDTVQVREGEVIAVPSNVPHAVFTRDKAALACDAWSPVMSQYVSPPLPAR